VELRPASSWLHSACRSSPVSVRARIHFLSPAKRPLSLILTAPHPRRTHSAVKPRASGNARTSWRWSQAEMAFSVSGSVSSSRACPSLFRRLSRSEAFFWLGYRCDMRICALAACCCCCCDPAIGAVICKIITGITDTHFDRSWGGRAVIHCHCHFVSLLGVEAEPNPEPRRRCGWFCQQGMTHNNRFSENKRQAK
jgi:hypothetical protein